MVSLNQNTHLLLLDHEEEEDIFRMPELAATQEEHRQRAATLTKE